MEQLYDTEEYLVKVRVTNERLEKEVQDRDIIINKLKQENERLLKKEKTLR